MTAANSGDGAIAAPAVAVETPADAMAAVPYAQNTVLATARATVTPARVWPQAASAVVRPAAAASAGQVAASQSPIAAAISSLVGAGSTIGTAVDGRSPVFTGIPEDALLGSVVDNTIYGLLDATTNFLDNRPPSPLNESLQGALLAVRRAFFDQAPYLDPAQLTGEVSGPITGTLGAYDYEGEPMTFEVIEQPLEGTVTVNPDGSYSYTPGSNFDGTDAFIVSATDKTAKANALLGRAGSPTAFGGNILDPKRPDYSEALVEVDQGPVQKITFDFKYYVKGLGRWNQKAKTDLDWVAYQLADAVNPQHTATVTYQVVADYNTDGLASAKRNFISTAAGFNMTVVQNRIINGTNPNGSKVDAKLDFDFSEPWGYSGEVAPGKKGQYNFRSVAMHEMLHTFGFLTTIDEPGDNTQLNWPVLAKFVTTGGGDPVISTKGVWNEDYNDNLLGANGGLGFNGSFANKAFFGAPVPIYTPSKWKAGSSGGHLNDDYFNNTDPNAKNAIQLMNAKDERGVKVPTTLSPYEIGILKDIGYTMRP